MDEGNYKSFFRLGEKERIIKYMKPLLGLRNMWIASGLTGFLFVALFFLVPFSFAVLSGGGFPEVFLIVFFIALIILGISVVFALLKYSKQDYWFTNSRVIIKTGLIGYKINSIPFERISDVIITRTFWESIFGIGGLFIQSFAGQITYGNRMGSEGSMPGVPFPEETQELIFKLIKDKRKTEKLTM